MAASHFSGPLVVGSGSIATIATAKTLVNEDSGMTFFLKATAGAAITLPSLAEAGAGGWRCKFIVGNTFATTAWTIVAPSNILRGGINELEVDTADDGPSSTSGTTITLVATLETVGDYIEIIYDTNKIYFNGQTALDGAVTIA